MVAACADSAAYCYYYFLRHVSTETNVIAKFPVSIFGKSSLLCGDVVCSACGVFDSGESLQSTTNKTQYALRWKKLVVMNCPVEY